nr:MAG TPA: hypothetical protein [Caudoviricetes sp.]
MVVILVYTILMLAKNEITSKKEVIIYLNRI